jgi:hypothetical protein
MPLGRPKDSQGKDWVALTLAIGIATAINCLTVAVLWDAIVSAGPGLSENATQVLTAAFGGMVGVLGSYIGFKASGYKESVDSGPAAELERNLPERAPSADPSAPSEMLHPDSESE